MKKRVALLCVAALLVALCAGCSGQKSPIKETVDVWARQESDLDLLALGAAGDGVADDTEAFEQAVAQAAEQGVRLYLPEGCYRLKKTVTVPRGVCVVFGPNATLLLDKGIIFNGTFAASEYFFIFDGRGQVVLPAGSYVSPCWFGAVGDGETDDTAAFTKAFETCTQVRVPYTAGGYCLTGLTTYRDWTMTGIVTADGKRPLLKATNKTYSMISVSDGEISDGGHATLENIDMDMAAAPDRSAAIYFDTASGWLYDIYIRHCNITDAYYTFYDSRTTTETDNRRAIFYLHIEDVLSKDNRYSTFQIVDFEGYIFFKGLTIDNAKSFEKHGLTEAFPMVNISHLAGNILQDVTLIGANTGKAEEVGFYYPGCTSVWFDGIKIRDIGGYGMVLDSYITSVSNCEITNCGGGMDLTGTDQIQLNKINISGRKDDPLGLSGLVLDGARWCQLTHVTADNNAGSGLESVSGSFLLTDCAFRNNARYGIAMPSGTDNQIVRCTCTGNGTMQIKARGSGLVVLDTVVSEGSAPISETDICEH